MNQIINLLQILLVVFQCSKSGAERSPCLLEVTPGPCKAYIPRFYYDIESQICKRFIYGGCAPNGNNFVTFNQCMNGCFIRHNIDDEGKCRDGSFPVNTLIDPCQATECHKQNSLCFADYCNDGLARFFTTDGEELGSTECMDSCGNVLCPRCNACKDVDGKAMCVPIKNCRQTRGVSIVDECDENMVYQRCGTACPETCDTVNKPVACILMCVIGCVCRFGFVLNTVNGHCIKKEDCPRAMTKRSTELYSMLIDRNCSFESVDIQSLTSDISNLGTNLFFELLKRKPSTNIFFSPTSISVMISEILIGTAGNSEKQILENIFPLSRTADNVFAMMRSLGRTLKDLHKSDQVVSEHDSFINSYQNVKSKFENLTSDCLGYDVLFANISGAIKINKFVELQSNDTMKDLFASGSIAASNIMIFSSADYFNTKWKYQFNISRTTNYFWSGVEGDAKKQIEMMELEDVELLHLSSSNYFKIVELPFEGDELVMYILLPYDNDGLKHLENQIKNHREGLGLGKAVKTRFRLVQVPRFKQEFTFDDLKESLMNLGMEDVFDDDANFTHLTSEKGFSVADVFHRASIEVNEEGIVEANNETVVLNKQFGYDFIVDHPFIYLVQHKSTGLILSVGRYVNPPV